MKTRALGFLLMVAAAGVYAVGCGSSNNNGGTGGAGTGGKGGAGAGGVGMGGKMGTGGVAGMGAGGSSDAGKGGKVTDGGTDSADTGGGTGGKVDGGNTDMAMDMAPGDVPVDGQGAPTFTDVYAIISNNAMAGCRTCHDGINPADGGAGAGLPHGMDFSTKAAAYAALVGVDSLRCGATDAGAALKRVLASNAAQSVLVQKLMQGMTGMTGANSGICDTAANSVGMPLNVPKPTDGGAPDGGDAGFTLTTYAVTAPQLATIQAWINAGALNN